MPRIIHDIRQGYLDGMHPSAADHFYFAFLPDKNAAEQAAIHEERIRRQRGLLKAPMDKARLHVTLQSLGTYDGVNTALIGQAREAASRLAISPFSISFDRIENFSSHFGEASVVLIASGGAGPLLAFHERLKASLAFSGVKMKKGGFTPHMTLIYNTDEVRPATITPLSWVAREFVLLHTKSNPYRRIVLGRWPLRGF